MTVKEKRIANYGTVLRGFRQQLGITQRELAMRIGVTESYIGNVETGTFQLPRDAMLKKWLKALEITDELKISELVGIARTCRMKISINYRAGDESNEDLARLVERYESGQLSDLDRALLLVIAR